MTMGLEKDEIAAWRGPRLTPSSPHPPPFPASFCLRLSWHPLLFRESLLSWWGSGEGGLTRNAVDVIQAKEAAAEET